MKILIIAVLLYNPFLVLSQKLQQNKVDDFTKLTIKRTSWETFSNTSKLYAYCRVSKIDSAYWLGFKMFAHGVGSVAKDAELMLMTVSDSVLILSNSEYQLSCNGCGAIGLMGSAALGYNLDFNMSTEKLDFLQKNPIKKIRIYTTDGYIEGELKEKFQQLLMKEIDLVK